MMTMGTESNRSSFENAKEYCEAQMRAENGDLGLIAWRFLIGCRILECLEDMFGTPNRGTDVQVIHANQDNYLIRLGDYEITVEHKPQEGLVNQVIEPNSK